MPLPLLILGVAAGLAANENTKRHYKNLERGRTRNLPGIGDLRTTSFQLVKPPSDYGHRKYIGTPPSGSIVCCEIYNTVEHTGIWIDRDTIIEFSENGLIKSMSYERFTKGRSGNSLYVACNEFGNAIVVEGVAERAVNQVFTFQEYSLLKNNCHSFVSRCIDDSCEPASLFSELNTNLANAGQNNIYWDKLEV